MNVDDVNVARCYWSVSYRRRRRQGGDSAWHRCVRWRRLSQHQRKENEKIRVYLVCLPIRGDDYRAAFISSVHYLLP
jgi:hypothetical protein